MSKQEMIKVWDPLVRIFHWALVIAFVIAYFTEDDLLTVHVYAGYTVAALVLARLIWGIVGSRYARFTDFMKPAYRLAILQRCSDVSQQTLYRA